VASAAVAAVISAVSLTRIAGDSLGFPDYLEWTLTGAVDIGAATGAVLWVTARDRDRLRGKWLNIACSSVSAIGVGLDHASNAAPGWAWAWVAFGMGAFLPALSTWLIHVLAHLVTDTPAPVVSVSPGEWTPQLDADPQDPKTWPWPSELTEEEKAAAKRAADAKRKREERARKAEGAVR
jgi:hypothetical protein